MPGKTGIYNLRHRLSGALSLLKNLYRYQKWGLGRSPKRGEGGSPTKRCLKSVEKPLSLSKMGFGVACSAGFASCKTFGKQPKRPCLVRAAAPHSAPARMPGVYAQRLCTMQSQQSIHSPSPRGRGLGFRQGCRDRTPKGFAGRKAHKAFLKG